MPGKEGKNHVNSAGSLLGGAGVRDDERLEPRPQAANVLTEIDGEGSGDLRMWEEQREPEADCDGHPGAQKVKTG